MRSSLHVLIRTGQIHFMQQNSMSNFGPAASEPPAQCYNIKMSFKLRQKINYSHPDHSASLIWMGVLCRTSVLPSQPIASAEGKATSSMFDVSSQRPICTHEINTACCKTLGSFHSWFLLPGQWKNVGVENPTQGCIKALDTPWSKLDCCDTGWLRLVPFPGLRNYRFEKTWLCEGQLEYLS